MDNHLIKKQNIKDYIDFKYDKVIAFASVNPMDYYDGDFNEKFDVKKFNDTISKTLNSTQLKELNDILSGRKNEHTDHNSISDCFYPRHNILFLNKDKIIHHITVCFECNAMKSSKQPLASMKNLEDFFSSLSLKVFSDPFEHAKYYDSLKSSHRYKLQ
ncbi:hypothetical protein PFY12_09760 [Chryseobacterium camelliae]|uniref:Uncharacterized protein n=1 Tax=Chryseobacterium camelliae TaxID=1265445 RepID=A0ABY7QI72_9FLAO|nr:hypothetical protein [Chryseobacterium camelliae]WBV59342.1 hypothetical protein PFY12_09760 [Chryseobacterium camelliae]